MATKSTENVRRTYGVQTDHYGQDIRNSSSDTLSVTKDRTIVRFRRIAETSLINNNSSTKSAPHNGSPSYSRNILTETEGISGVGHISAATTKKATSAAIFVFGDSSLKIDEPDTTTTQNGALGWHLCGHLCGPERAEVMQETHYTCMHLAMEP